MPASGRHSHKGQGEKTEKSVTPNLLQVSARFLLPELQGLIELNKKLRWSQ